MADDEERLADCRDAARCLAGDREAFAAIVRRHEQRLRAHLATMVGADAADDLAQETLIRAWNALARYDPTYPFRAWLLVIATRLAINHARGRRHAKLDGIDPPAPMAPAEDEQAVLLGRLAGGLDQLAAEDRAIYELRYRQALPIQQVAVCLGITANATKVRLHRMRSRLSQLLNIDPPLEDLP